VRPPDGLLSGDMKNLAVVSGASAGIGLATARQFLEREYDVVSISRRPCPCANVASLLVDLTSADSAIALREWAAATLQSPRRVVLIHNAASSWHDSVDSANLDALRAMLELSVVAAAALNRLLLPSMSQGSAIIYVGSTLSTKAVPNSFSYVTAKHAVVGMMRATCQDLFGKGIHTACICPGATDTDMLTSLFGEEMLEKMGKMASVGRLISPEEIADVIFMAANTPVMNGALIHANFGQREQ
jgi:3-oxoacyl-[acyl-carrier protein] reductase